ncbi:MAG: hypothetical protein JO235_12140 [Chroococcidiopsidaceae cyanobacterium CP_BM_RX_35]|nr:hypothetical protein [Chroococcidiopsidaceae cyanobacterium CP_BM_RX_35]
MKVKLKTVISAVIGIVIISADASYAQSIVYPQRGQSQEQQSKDEYECYTWAKQKTGVDPTQTAAQGSGPVAQAPNGQVLRGAGRGAIAGTVGGAIGGDTGKGAAIGAGVGATAGLIRTHQAQRVAEQYNQQAQGNQQRSLEVYYRALGACWKDAATLSSRFEPRKLAVSLVRL